MQVQFPRQRAYILSRLAILISLAIFAAHYLSREAYSEYFSKTLIKVHAARSFGPDPNDLSRLLIGRNFPQLQELLDSNAAVYALVITNCTTEAERCENQSILLATSPNLIGGRSFTADELIRYPYVVLRHPPASILDLLQRQSGKEPARSTIIGRVYSISTIPTFAEDYRSWLRNPFSHSSPLWRSYLVTAAACLFSAVMGWLILELFLKIRRVERWSARQREAELLDDADTNLRQLEETERKVRDQEERSRIQYDVHIQRIRELERTLQHTDESRAAAEAIVGELEAEKERLAASYRDELARTELQKKSLQAEFERYRQASGREKAGASAALEDALFPPSSTSFERRVLSTLSKSPKAQQGAWRVLSEFDVAVGKGGSQFVDAMIISRECVIVVEAKNHSGTIRAEGDVENTGWVSIDENGGAVGIKTVWGLNPYHQVREYTMSLLNLVKRGSWKVPVFGVIVFPDDADARELPERIGRYYRITTRDRLISIVERLEGEARRENAFTKRPSPAQLEGLLRGK